MKSLLSIRNLLVIIMLLLAAWLIVPLATSSPNTQATPATTKSYAQPLATSNPKTVQLGQRVDYGAWSYLARRAGDTAGNYNGVQIGPNDIEVTVRFPANVANGAYNYVVANRHMLAQVSGNGGQKEVWIIFRDYITPGDFRTFAKAHSLSTTVTYMRGIDESKGQKDYIKMRITPLPGNSNPIPQTKLDEINRYDAAKSPKFTFKGVYTTRTWVGAKELPAIAADPRVFFVDVTPNIVRSDLTAAGIAGAEKANVEAGGDAIFWYIENGKLNSQE